MRDLGIIVGMKQLKFIFALLLLILIGGVSFASENPLSEQLISQSIHRSPSLSKRDRAVHVKCIRNQTEVTAKLPQTFLYTDLKESACLEQHAPPSKRKTTQELSLSYQFFRLNILSSQAHPPTHC